MERKALERLVAALVADEHANDRAEKIENALVYAQIALWGEDEIDEDELQTCLRQLAVQLMVNTMDKDGLSIYQTMVLDEDEKEVAQIIATSNPIVASIINHTVERTLKETTKYDTH